MCQSPKLNIDGLVNPEIIQDEDQFTLRPSLDSLVQKGQKVLTAATISAVCQRFARFGFKGTKDPQECPAAIIGSHTWWSVGGSPAFAKIGSGGQGPQLIDANHMRIGWWRLVMGDY